LTLTPPSVDLDIRKVTAHIGAEVFGVDISQPLDASTVAALRGGLNDHKVLVFRDVQLDDAAQQRFASSFGDLTSAHPTVPALDGEPNVLAVDSDRNVANHWHTDVTFIVNPPQLSTLRSIELPPYGGETLIANTGAAYQALPEPLRRLADQLWAVHSNSYDYVGVNLAELDEENRARFAVFTSIEYETAHPVVRVHPITGERGLFIGGFARKIKGLSAEESRDILRILQAYVSRPEHVLRWRWSPNELVLFDNRITQHYAIDNYDRLPRRLRRVTVAGDVPVGVDGERSYAIKGDASHYTPVLEAVAA
jgi:alpha-ketoglutarate-dependent sulfate ester dioxygenase